jgi:hypothetical protein
MRVLFLALLTACSTPQPAPQVIVVERTVYVERDAERERNEALDRMLVPTAPIPESPLLVAAEEQREEAAARRVEPEPEVEIVYVPVYVEEPRRLSTIERQRLGRELERCERRATRFARERCEERTRAR